MRDSTEMNVELDELKLAWRTLNDRLEKLEAQSLRIDRARRASRLFMFSPAVDLIQDAILVVLLGIFLAAHVAEPRFLVPAALLQALIIASLVSSVRQLVLVASVDYGGAVVGIQRQLATARALRIRTNQRVLLLVPFVWMPLLIVGARALGVDVYEAFGIGFFLWNFGFSVLVPLLLWWVAGRVVRQWEGTRWYQRFLDDLGGRNLARAMAFLDDVARFEKD